MVSKNPLTSLLVTVVFLIVFFGLLTILAHVFIFVVVVGLVLYLLTKIRNFLFPKARLSPEERLRNFTNKLHAYQQQQQQRQSGRGYSQQHSQHSQYSHSSNYNEEHISVEQQESQKTASKPRGRIIDVEPEK